MGSNLNENQKLGISLLIASKAFERLAFYSIVTIFIQYLSESFSLKGNVAGVYYSIFYAVIGISIFFSGYLGDIKDRMKVVKTGFIIMAIMYLAMIFMPSVNVAVLACLIVLGIGIGLITPNTIVFLGNIYNEKGNQIKGLPGFLLFHIAINIGAFLAPLVSLYLKNNFGYSAVFIFAFILVVLSYVLFVQFQNHYNKLNINVQDNSTVENSKSKSLNRLILPSILGLALVICFALGQKSAAFSFAAQDYIGEFLSKQTLSIAGISLCVIILFAFVIPLTRMKELKWSTVFNVIIIGLLFPIVAFILIASISSLSKFMSGQIIFAQSYIMVMIAETLILPAFTYSVYKSSPRKYKGLFQGILYAIVAIGGSLSVLGFVLYSAIGSITFIVFAVVLIITVALIMALKRVVNQKLNEL